MMLPAKPLLAALAAWLMLALASTFLPILQTVCGLTGMALLLWVATDWLLTTGRPLPAVQRVVSDTLPVGAWSQVELRLHWTGPVSAMLQAFDHHPPGFAQEGLPATINPDGHNSQALRYRIRPLSRGKHDFGLVEIRIESPWRAWTRQARIGKIQTVRVYPDFAPLTGHALRAVDPRQARFGLQQRRRRGQGMDFAQLREYREGDSLRQIDWKASTRMGKMISREYQDERDQRILLLIDCGRRMGARDTENGQTGLSHFDHSLDTVLMLAYVALSHGDRVGLMTLGGPDRYLPCAHSASAVSRILAETYDLQPTLQASDFESAAQKLLYREKKRALVVLLTNLRDEDDQNLLNAVRLLGRHHLVLVASLREAALDAAQRGAVNNAEDAARLAAAVDHARRRETALHRLRAEGVLCLDVTPQELAVETVNRYLAVKAASLL